METRVMARFEAHPKGIAFISIAAPEAARLSSEHPNLLETFQNGGAVVRGDVKPLRLTLTPSWNSGNPLVALPDGSFAVEIDRPAVGLSPRTAALVEALSISCTEEGFNLVESRQSTRAKPTTVHQDVNAAILAAVARGPVSEQALRFMVPDRHPDEVSKSLEDLLANRRIGYNDDKLVLVDAGADAATTSATDIATVAKSASAKIRSAKAGSPKAPETASLPAVTDTSPLNPKLPFKALAEVRKWITRSDTAGIEIKVLVKKTKLDKSLVEECVDDLCSRLIVFKDEDKYRIPDDHGRGDVFDMVNEYLYDVGSEHKPAEEIVKALDDFHPAWVRKTLETMVKRGQVEFDGTLYGFRMPERFRRSTGIFKVRDIIEKAADKGIPLEQLYDALPEFPFYLIRWNIRSLAQSRRIIYKDETCYWNKDAVVAPVSTKQRLSFRDEIREALRAAGPQGMTRERVFEMFTADPHKANPTKISIALNDLIGRSEAVLRAKHYRFVDTIPAQA